MTAAEALNAFEAYLRAVNAPSSTVLTYLQRLRAVLNTVAWPPTLVGLDVYLANLPESSATQTRSAWNCFASWCTGRAGLTLPVFPRVAKRSLTRATTLEGVALSGAQLVAVRKMISNWALGEQALDEGEGMPARSRRAHVIQCAAQYGVAGLALDDLAEKLGFPKEEA